RLRDPSYFRLPHLRDGAVWLMIVHTYGYFSTLLCLTLNLLVVWLVFTESHWILRFMKEGGTKGVAKVSSLLMAAFAMMMIRIGIKEWMDMFFQSHF
ncbi:MAG: MarC family protein, partial [Pseudomonadota bacterium]